VNPWFLFITFVLVIFNGFFVAMEFALVGSRRAKLEELAADGSRRAKTALDASSDLTMQLAGAQLGVTMASLGIGFFGEPTVAHFIENTLESRVDIPHGWINAIGLVIGLGIVVFVHMILGEVVPKNVALSGPERLLLWLAPPARLYLKVFRPIVRGLQAMANAGVRLFKVEPRDELTSAHTAQELAVMLAESHEGGLIEEFAHDLMTGVLDFGGRTVESVMVPRDDVIVVPRLATVAEVERAVVESGHSRIPVVDNDIDSVLGFVHSKDLLTLPASAQHQPIPLRLVRRMLVAPTDRSLEVLLLSMRRERVHFALVREQNGATAGVVTIEDLLEELVGDILDESDHQEAIEADIADALLNDAPPADDGERS
jgi:CBS domain containing-hemolysin-like protein